ncbi:MAG: hypothetical protein HY537_04305, partial [Deltaproteobacteria bacterium]|nr:hypothetical protein [Deltaproteobacteria bacterium]
MIRIDLAKDELEKETGAGKFTLAGLKLPRGFNVEKLRLDVAALAIFAVALALAALPTLFFVQYRNSVRTEHQIKIQVLKQDTETAQSEIQKYMIFQTELQSYEQQKKQVAERLAIVRRLLSARGTPVNVLDVISQNLP